MEYVVLVAAALLLAVDFCLIKIYQKMKGTSPSAGFGFNSLLGLFTAIIFFVINSFEINFSVYSLIMAAMVNGFVVCYSIIGFRLLKMGTMAVYTLFLMSGGMILPYIFGLLFLGEPFSFLKAIGIISILTGVIISNADNAKVNSKQIAMCIAVFVINGFTSVFSKLHQTELGFETVNVIDFVVLGGVFKFIFAGILYLSVKRTAKKNKCEKTLALPLLVIIASAVASGTSYLMQLWGAASLPATVLYPFVTGGSIVASSLAGVIFFRDRISKKLLISIALCFAGTIMFL